jgi:hypothetical protein
MTQLSSNAMSLLVTNPIPKFAEPVCNISGTNSGFRYLNKGRSVSISRLGTISIGNEYDL